MSADLTQPVANESITCVQITKVCLLDTVQNSNSVGVLVWHDR